MVVAAAVVMKMAEKVVAVVVLSPELQSDEISVQTLDYVND